MKAATVLVMAMAVCAGCSSPMAMRSARVLEPGEVEVLVAGEGTLAYDVKNDRNLQLVSAQGSVRAGIIDRLDAQVRWTTSSWTMVPEVSAGLQFVGDPTRDDDIAVTATAGVRPFVNSAVLTFPLQLLAEVPINDQASLTGGLRVIPLLGGANGIAPGITVGFRSRLGPVVVQPELAFAGNFTQGLPITDGERSVLIDDQALVAGTFGISLGGQFDFFAQPSSRARLPSSPSVRAHEMPAPRLPPLEPAPAPPPALLDAEAEAAAAARVPDDVPPE